MEILDFSEFITTPLQAKDFSSRLTAITEKMYLTEFNFEMALLEQFGIQKRDKIIMLLRNNNVDIESTTALRMFLNKLAAQAAALPVLNLTLAFEPKTETLQLLSQWFLANAGKQVLFDIQVDPSLIAGIAITASGKFMDFSVKPQFDQVIKEVLENSPKPTAAPVFPVRTPRDTAKSEQPILPESLSVQPVLPPEQLLPESSQPVVQNENREGVNESIPVSAEKHTEASKGSGFNPSVLKEADPHRTNLLDSLARQRNEHLKELEQNPPQQTVTASIVPPQKKPATFQAETQTPPPLVQSPIPSAAPQQDSVSASPSNPGQEKKSGGFKWSFFTKVETK